MKLQYDVIYYNIEEALVYLKKLLKEIKNKSIIEEEFIPDMEHIYCHLNIAFNARHLTRKQVIKLSQKEHDEYALPPGEIFNSLKKISKKK